MRVDPRYFLDDEYWREEPRHARRTWEYTFIVLGFERSRPFLRDLGLPTAMLRRPGPLRREARRLLELGLGDWFGLYYESEQLRTLVAEAFMTLAEAYGPSAAQALASWARRLFVDHIQSESLSNWSAAFSRLAWHMSGLGHESIPVPLSPHLNRQIEQVAVREFGLDAERRISNLEARLRRTPPSPLEMRAQAWDPKLAPPDDLQQDFLPNLLTLGIGRARAYRVWMKLDPSLTDGDRAALLPWAEKQLALSAVGRVGPLDLPPRTSEFRFSKRVRQLSGK